MFLVLSTPLKRIITFLVRELRWTFTHIIIIFSRTEGAAGERSSERNSCTCSENENNVMNDYFHFRYNHEMSCERSSRWHLNTQGRIDRMKGFSNVKRGLHTT